MPLFLTQKLTVGEIEWFQVPGVQQQLPAVQATCQPPPLNTQARLWLSYRSLKTHTILFKNSPLMSSLKISLSAFLREVLSHSAKNGIDPKILATLFCNLFLRVNMAFHRGVPRFGPSEIKLPFLPSAVLVLSYSLLAPVSQSCFVQDPPGTNYGTGLRAKTAQQMCDRWDSITSLVLVFNTLLFCRKKTSFVYHFLVNESDDWVLLEKANDALKVDVYYDAKIPILQSNFQ